MVVEGVEDLTVVVEDTNVMLIRSASYIFGVYKS